MAAALATDSAAGDPRIETLERRAERAEAVVDELRQTVHGIETRVAVIDERTARGEKMLTEVLADVRSILVDKDLVRKEEFKKVQNDVEALMASRWKIMGFAIGVASAAGGTVSAIMNAFGHQ